MAFKFSEARSRRDDRGGIGGVDSGTEGAAGGGTGGGALHQELVVRPVPVRCKQRRVLVL